MTNIFLFNEELDEHNRNEKICSFCGKSYVDDNTYTRYSICGECAELELSSLFRTYFEHTDSRNPIDMVTLLMNNKNLRMHSAEHHFIFAGALVSAYYNIVDNPDVKMKKLDLAKKRAGKIPMHCCGLWGACGAAIATGLFIALITDSTVISKKEWRLANTMTSRSLAKIAIHGGPRCCKRDGYLAIIEANKFLKENFGIEFEMPSEIRCLFSTWNKDCIKEKCPFYAQAMNPVLLQKL